MSNVQQRALHNVSSLGPTPLSSLMSCGWIDPCSGFGPALLTGSGIWDVLMTKSPTMILHNTKTKSLVAILVQSDTLMVLLSKLIIFFVEHRIVCGPKMAHQLYMKWPIHGGTHEEWPGCAVPLVTLLEADGRLLWRAAVGPMSWGYRLWLRNPRAKWKHMWRDWNQSCKMA